MHQDFLVEGETLSMKSTTLDTVKAQELADLLVVSPSLPRPVSFDSLVFLEVTFLPGSCAILAKALEKTLLLRAFSLLHCCGKVKESDSAKIEEAKGRDDPSESFSLIDQKFQEVLLLLSGLKKNKGIRQVILKDVHTEQVGPVMEEILKDNRGFEELELERVHVSSGTLKQLAHYPSLRRLALDECGVGKRQALQEELCLLLDSSSSSSCLQVLSLRANELQLQVVEQQPTVGDDKSDLDFEELSSDDEEDVSDESLLEEKILKRKEESEDESDDSDDDEILTRKTKKIIKGKSRLEDKAKKRKKDPPGKFKLKAKKVTGSLSAKHLSTLAAQIPLLHALKKNRSVILVNLSDNNLKGCNFGELLKENSTLTSLSLKSCQLSEKDIKGVAKSLHNNTTLWELDLSGDNELSSNALGYLLLSLEHNCTIRSMVLESKETATVELVNSINRQLQKRNEALKAKTTSFPIPSSSPPSITSPTPTDDSYSLSSNTAAAVLQPQISSTSVLSSPPNSSSLVQSSRPATVRFSNPVTSNLKVKGKKRDQDERKPVDESAKIGFGREGDREKEITRDRDRDRDSVEIGSASDDLMPGEKSLNKKKARVRISEDNTNPLEERRGSGVRRDTAKEAREAREGVINHPISQSAGILLVAGRKRESEGERRINDSSDGHAEEEGGDYRSSSASLLMYNPNHMTTVPHTHAQPLPPPHVSSGSTALSTSTSSSLHGSTGAAINPHSHGVTHTEKLNRDINTLKHQLDFLTDRLNKDINNLKARHEVQEKRDTQYIETKKIEIKVKDKQRKAKVLIAQMQRDIKKEKKANSLYKQERVEKEAEMMEKIKEMEVRMVKEMDDLNALFRMELRNTQFVFVSGVGVCFFLGLIVGFVLGHKRKMLPASLS